jgi:hypothetical protein
MSQSSPEGIILSKGSTLVSAELSINEEKVLKMSQEESTSCTCGANKSCQCEPEEYYGGLEMGQIPNRDLEYWKDNAEEDYITTPISVLRYISELEKEVERLKKE